MPHSEPEALTSPDALSANGRPLGSPAFIAVAEPQLRRSLRPQRPGPKPRGDAVAQIGDCAACPRNPYGWMPPKPWQRVNLEH